MAASKIVKHHRAGVGGQTNSKMYKGIIVGQSGVGKTALLRFYKEKKFTKTKATINTDFMEFLIPVKDQVVNVTFWDTGGQEKLSPILPKEFYQEANAAIIMYDSRRRETFEKVYDWLYHIRQQCPEDVKIFLVSGKGKIRDIKRLLHLRNEDAEALARKEKLEFHYTSAKYGLGVDRLFKSVAEHLVTKSPKEDSSAVVIRKEGEKEAKKQQSNWKFASYNYVNVNFHL